jgi:signal transduction histidine kinase/HAMP domain-containing protein
MPISLPGKSLKAQLITLLFGLTAISIVVVAFLGVRGVLESGDRSGAISGDSHQKIVEQLMVQTVSATASENSLIFKHIQQDSATATEFTKSLFDNPAAYPASWRFDAHAIRLPTGQYANDASELSSVLVNPGVKLTAGVKHEFELTSYLDHLVPQILKNDANIAATYFIGPHGESRYYPNIGLAKITPPDFDASTQSFFTVADPAHDPGKTIQWTPVYDDPAGNGLMITATNPVYTNAGSFVGVVGMDVTLRDIAKNIEHYSPIESSYAFLTDDAGRAIALPAQGYQDLLGRAAKKDEFGTDLSGVKGDFAGVLRNMRAGKNGFSNVTAGGTALYVAYAPIGGTGFTLGIVGRQAVMLKVVHDLQSQVAASTRQVLLYRILPAAVILLVIVWLVGFVYIRLITEPIKLLTAKTARISHGDLDVEPATVHVSNEIGTLASSFNRMVTDLRDSRRQIAQQTQELLHNEQTRLKASINSLKVGFIMTDTSDKVLLLNDTAQNILGLEGQWNFAAINGRLGEKIAFADIVHRALKASRPVELKEVDFEGSILRIFVAPILEHSSKSGATKAATEKLGAVVLLEDITEVKQAERSKDEFFSIASHELRTPLTAVRGNAALLRQVFGDKLHNRDFDDMVGDIHSASVRLIEIVNDFLDASRLEQGRIAYEKQAFAIQDVIGEVATEIKAVAKEKGNHIKIAPDVAGLPPIFADRNRTKQIVYNLIGNAIKFTENGTITISAHAKGKQLKVLVSDTGPGITLEKQHLLFRKFQQAGNTRLTHDASHGTGLGLYISKLLAEQMGGGISLDHSKVGEGTAFSFTLPLAPKAKN